jgi:hypothetical protein
MNYRIICLLVFFSVLHSEAAILVEEKGRPVGRSDASQRLSYGPSYESAFSFKKDRRVGIVIKNSGSVGMFGAGLELNFAPDEAFTIAAGGSLKYKSVAVGWKKSFDGAFFSPAIGVSVSRWSSALVEGSSVGETSPEFLGNGLLSEQEKLSGQFSKHFVAPGAYLQYLQLDGPYRGFSMSVGVELLTNIEKLSSFPTGEVGIGYFF